MIQVTFCTCTCSIKPCTRTVHPIITTTVFLNAIYVTPVFHTHILIPFLPRPLSWLNKISTHKYILKHPTAIHPISTLWKCFPHPPKILGRTLAWNVTVSWGSAIVYTVVSQVSAHGRLNITRDFGPHGRLPGIKIPYVCIEAATVAPWNALHGHLPGSGRLPGTLW